MSNLPIFYRKRLIPSECVLLKHDELIYQDDNVFLTKWRTLKPKPTLAGGVSCYFLNEGWKVSRFIDYEGKLLYWYCDIIDTEYQKESNTYVFVDLLADVLIYPDGRVEVIDLDEVADALDQNLITTEQMKSCMRNLNSLLQLIYSGKLFDLEPIKRLAAIDISGDLTSRI